MPEDGRLGDDAQAAQLVPFFLQFDQGLDNVIHVRLGVNAAWKSEADQFQRRPFSARPAEHDRADLDAANAGMAIQSNQKGLAGKPLGREVRAEGAGVEINRMAARW